MRKEVSNKDRVVPQDGDMFFLRGPRDPTEIKLTQKGSQVTGGGKDQVKVTANLMEDVKESQTVPTSTQSRIFPYSTDRNKGR